MITGISTPANGYAWGVTQYSPYIPPLVTTDPSPKAAKTASCKKAKPMCDYYDCCDCKDSQPTIENRKLTYVQNRVDSAAYVRRQEMRKMFNLDDDSAPTTGQELIDRIASGKFTVATEEEFNKKNSWNYGPLSWFTWRDPAVKADMDGYNKAADELAKVVSRATDVVTLETNSTTLQTAIDSIVNFQPSNAPAATA